MALWAEIQPWLTLAAALAGAGAITGVLAGLFGVGGGAITVPLLFETFTILDIAESVRMPLAVGTSLAIIVPTSLRSAFAHHRRGAVDMALLRLWAPALLLGVALGSVTASIADPWVFQAAFIFVASVVSTKLLLGRRDWRLADDFPSRAAVRLYGVVTGYLSALMGIGGGAVSTLLMTLHGRPIHQAVATSAGVGVLISIPGAIGYALAGWGGEALPPDAIGFVSLLGFVLVTPTTLLTAPLGVRLAHSLPRRRLELLFGLFLLTVCARFLWAVL